jgi:hypothetical protein
VAIQSSAALISGGRATPGARVSSGADGDPEAEAEIDGAPSVARAGPISALAVAIANIPTMRHAARPSKTIRGLTRWLLPQRRQAYAEREMSFAHFPQRLCAVRTG